MVAARADGKNGLRVLQLTSPELPGNDGFSPRPNPCLIATRKLPKNGHALCVSRGVDRDRAVDESGNQIAVFGRVGARPHNKDESTRMHRRKDGSLFQVSDDPFDPRTYPFPVELRPFLRTGEQALPPIFLAVPIPPDPKLAPNGLPSDYLVDQRARWISSGLMIS